MEPTSPSPGLEEWPGSAAAAGSAAAGALGDANSNAGFACLNDLTARNLLSEEECSRYKDHFLRLKAAVEKKFENETVLLQEAKRLTSDLHKLMHNLEDAGTGSFDDNTQIAEMRRQLLNIENEQALCTERSASLDAQKKDLTRHRNELDREANSIKQMQSEMLEPQIHQLQQTIEEVRSDMAQQEQQLEKQKREKAEVAEHIRSLEAVRLELDTEKNSFKILLSKMKNDPEKIKKQADVVQMAAQNLSNESGRLANQIAELEHELAKQAEVRKRCEDEQISLALQLEKHRSAIEQKDRQGDQIHRELDLAKEEANQHLADRVRYEMHLKSLNSEVRRENEALLRKMREKEAVLRALRRAEFMLNSGLAGLPPLQQQVEDLQRRMEAMRTEKRRAQRELDEMKQEVDIYIANFLKQEQVEQSKVAQVTHLQADIKAYEGEVSRLTVQEHDLAREITRISAARQIKAREAGKAVARLKAIQEEIKVKDLVVFDLRKKAAELTNQHTSFSQLYELVKNERNKYVNLIQASSQATAEMKEKLKILQNEIEILRNESLTKDKALTRERLNFQNAFKSRDNLRNETNRHTYIARQKQEMVDQQITDIDKLNAMINATEDEMFRLKQLYESAVEDRNATGIYLIDRNDELCILYEKSNIQESILKKGQAELTARDEEKRVLAITERDLQRELQVLRRLQPRKNELQREIDSLQAQVRDEEQLVQRLSNELEDPENTRRWRRLGGSDRSSDELATQMQRIEERLNDKQEQLLEKELVLEEVSGLAERLRSQAAVGRRETLQLGKQVNEVQARIKEVTRKMMATVSELSMYQASSLNLEQKRNQQVKELEEGQARMARGDAPSDSAEKEWEHLQQQKVLLAAAQANQDAFNASLGAGGKALVRTTAEARPNAYIPDTDLRIPKPYGAAAPFVPSRPGANMRHFAKPRVEQVQL